MQFPVHHNDSSSFQLHSISTLITPHESDLQLSTSRADLSGLQRVSNEIRKSTLVTRIQPVRREQAMSCSSLSVVREENQRGRFRVFRKEGFERE